MSMTKPRSLPTSYTWSFTGSPIQITVRLSVIADLQRVLDRPNTGELPLCGLLQGSPSRPGLTEISGFEAVPTLLPAAIEKILHQKSGIVGFYRTTEKGSLCMSDQDMTLARTYFNDPGFVVLLIEADQTGPSNAVFFFWDQGEIHGDLALMEFPFDAYQLALTERRRSEILERTLERPTPAPERVALVAAKSSSRRTSALVTAALVIAGGVGASLYFVRGRNASAAPPAQKAVEPTPAAPSLGLALDRHGADLQLYWNNQAQPILNGRFGMVLIREGEKTRTIALNQDQLRSGSILYEPTTDEVEMQLNVISGDRVTRESITAVLPPAGTAHPVISSAQIVQPVSQRVASRDEPESATNEPVQRELRKFSVPAASKTTARAPASSLTEPPLVATAAGTGNPISLPAWSPFPLPPPPSSPISSPRLPDPSTPASTAESRKSTAPDPPVAIHQVVPRFPAEMKSILIKPASVAILVKIDVHGNVVDAQPTAAQKVNAVLIQSALNAARSWTFRPAAIAGTPVPGEMILTFNFTPTR